ncbi:MAG: hypothetical protein KDC00_08315 [Flavobacteriales bacterium]|nr:hypothetical protein [Flavobacteriales bacterium]
MIKFFRSIRQRMIKENRVSKYLLYAIGEIVLVVIGILIALQINNWNENRKNTHRIEGYTRSLIEDLAKDSLQLTEALHYVKEDSLSIVGFEDRVNRSVHPLDTLYHIARFEYNHYVGGLRDLNTDTYEMLTSTGDLALFDQEIINELSALANLQEVAEDGRNFTWDILLDHYLNYSRKYPVRVEHSFIQGGSKVDDIMREEVSLTEHAALFNALVTAKKNNNRIWLVILPALSEKTNALLDDLRKQ